MDVASKNLKNILEGDEFVLFERSVPLFDEHSEFDKSGKLVRKFGPAELKTIAKQCNNRANTTGDLAPWGPGHTRDDVETEDDQPPIRGYYHNYRVGKYGPSGKLAVLADCYVQHTVMTKDGKKIDGRTYARGLPRRSVELWPNSMTIDWVAHLRRSPMRDLGLATYARSAYEVLYSPGRVMIAARMTGSNKLRYQMETDMPFPETETEREAEKPGDTTPADIDPTVAPADELEPEGHEDFVKHMDHALKTHPVMKYMHGMCKKYAANMVSPTNAAPPGAGLPGKEPGDEEEPMQYENDTPQGDQPVTPVKKLGDGEALKNMKEQRNGVVVNRYQKQIDTLTEKIANTEKREKLARYEKEFTEMVFNEGIEMDVPDELLDCAAMTDEQFNARKEKIRKNYQRSPVGARLPEGFIPKEVGTDPLEKNADEIIRYAREKNLSSTHGSDAFFEAARQLKYIK